MASETKTGLFTDFVCCCISFFANVLELLTLAQNSISELRGISDFSKSGFLKPQHYCHIPGKAITMECLMWFVLTSMDMETSWVCMLCESWGITWRVWETRRGIECHAHQDNAISIITTKICIMTSWTICFSAMNIQNDAHSVCDRANNNSGETKAPLFNISQI